MRTISDRQMKIEDERAEIQYWISREKFLSRGVADCPLPVDNFDDKKSEKYYNTLNRETNKYLKINKY